jgi:hypothetical protein
VSGRAPCVIVLAALLAPAVARAQSIPVGPGGEMSSLVGLPFDMPITVDLRARTERLGSFAMRVQWDPAALRLDNVALGSFGALTVNLDTVLQGVVRLAGVNPTGASGLVTVGVMRFTPLAEASSAVDLDLTELFAATSFADLLPSAVVSDGLYCPAVGRYGDIDRDGVANSRDALIALSNAVGLDVSAFNIALGDVDASGAANARDALIILSAAVGLDVSAFRVMRLAGGSCVAEPVVALALSPSDVELIVGQEGVLEARASDPSGALVSVTDATWSSSNTAVAAVTQSGRVLARVPGTAVITARRGADSAQATITVLAGRTLHVVDAVAIGAANRLGWAMLPFATIGEAGAFAAEGDTILVRSGRYDGGSSLPRAVTLLGDTLLDGTRPLIAGYGDPLYAGPGLVLGGGGSVLVRDLAFDNLYSAVELSGPGSARMVGLRGTRLENGIRVLLAMDALRVEGSQLIGRGAEFFDSDGIQAGARVDTLVLEGSELGDFGGYGIYAPAGDSISIKRSSVHDVGLNAVYLGGNGPSVALVVDSSRVQRSFYELFYIQDLRTGVFTNSVLANPDDDLIYQYQENIPDGGMIVLRNDSIVQEGCCYWLDVDGLDSVVVDSVLAVLPYGYSYLYNVGLVRVTRSRLVDLYGTAFNVYYGGSGTGGRVDVRNSTFVGDPRCDQCGDAFYVSYAAVTVDSSTFINLGDGIDAYGDSGISVTNSTFRRVYNGVEWEGNYYAGCTTCDPNVTALLRGNTFDDFNYAVELYDGRIVVDSNTFTSGYDAIDASSDLPIEVTRNTITGVEYGIDADLDDNSAYITIADNVLNDVEYEGIYSSGDYYQFSPGRPRQTILRNVVRCLGTYYYASGISAYSGDMVIQDNQVENCRYGIETYSYSDTALVDSIIGNTVMLPASGYVGIYANGKLRSRISRNVVTGPRIGSFAYGYGGIYLTGDYYLRGSVGLIDSNTVTGVSRYGVFTNYVDTIAIGANTIDSVFNDGTGAVGIQLAGSAMYLAGISGNRVRYSDGNGVEVYNGDTATVQVDSNLIAGNALSGISLTYAQSAQITRNNVTGNRQFGISSGSSGVVSLGLNNIAGNAFGLTSVYALSAPNNWWGDPLGPRCTSGCDPGSTGDSVSTTVSFSPPLASPEPSAPTAAPPALRVAGLRALPGRRTATPPPTVRRSARPAGSLPVIAPPAARVLPPGAPPEVVELVARRQEERARVVAERERVRVEREARRSRQEAEVQARREQRRAERQSREPQAGAAPARPVPGVRP